MSTKRDIGTQTVDMRDLYARPSRELYFNEYTARRIINQNVVNIGSITPEAGKIIDNKVKNAAIEITKHIIDAIIEKYEALQDRIEMLELKIESLENERRYLLAELEDMTKLAENTGAISLKQNVVRLESAMKRKTEIKKTINTLEWENKMMKEEIITLKFQL